MSSSPHSVKERLRAEILRLAQACPFDATNPEDCPFSLMRQLEPREQKQWLNTLDEDDLRYLVSYHHICHRTKVELQWVKGGPKPPGARELGARERT